MGDFFKKEKNKEDKKELELITDIDDLYNVYDSVVNKIQETTSQGYEAILPIRHDLFGGDDSPDDIGQIGQLKRMLKMSRLRRMEMGQKTWMVIEKIGDLDAWSDRYGEFLEQHIDALKLVCQSAFKIIEKREVEEDMLKTTIETQRNELEQKGSIEEESETKKKATPQMRRENVQMKMTPQEWDKKIQERIQVYGKFLKEGDKRQFSLAKGRVMILCWTEEQRTYVQGLIYNIEQEIRQNKDLSQKNFAQNPPVFSPVSPISTQKIPLSNDENTEKEEKDTNNDGMY